MSLLTRRTVLFTLAAAPMAVRAQGTTPVVFHFYGAENCPPCLAFKRDGLPIVEAAARTAGFAVAENMIGRTEDIDQIGIYGAADPLLRRVGPSLDRVYPPIFFVTRASDVLSVHGPRWRDALAAAETAAAG